MNRIIKATAVALVAIAAYSTPASATLVTNVVSCTGFSGSSLSINSVSCAQYNGVSPLLSMTLSITGSIGGTFTMSTTTVATNVLGTSTANFSLNSGLTGFSAAPFPTTLFQTIFNTPLVGQLGSPNPPSASFPISVTGGAALGSPSTLVPYTGAGAFPISLRTQASFSCLADQSNSVECGHVLTFSGGATVNYTYDDGTVTTPEPASMALLGAGMLALGVARRRRRS